MGQQTSFSSKTAVVTGASSGIGLAIVRQLVARGCKVFAVARREDRLRSLAMEYAGVVPVVQDVTAPLDALTQAIGSEPVDILVNNAGLAWGRDRLQEAPRERWETMIDVNVKALIAVTQLILPRMIKAGCGDVMNIGSVAAYESYEGGSAYCATKAAVKAITESLRHDTLGTGVRVMAVHPGMVETEFSLVRFDGDAARARKVYEGMTPLSADDVAETIHWMLSRPRHVCVDALTLLATDQAGATKVWRRI